MTRRVLSHWLASLAFGLALSQFMLAPASNAVAQSSDQANTENAEAETPDTNSDAEQTPQSSSDQTQSNQTNVAPDQPAPQPAAPDANQSPNAAQPAPTSSSQPSTLPAPANPNAQENLPNNQQNQQPGSTLNQPPANQPNNMREPQRDQPQGDQQLSNQPNQQVDQQVDQQLGIEFDQVQAPQRNQPSAQVNGFTQSGLTIRTIQPQSVFFNSGLRPGDVLLSVDNRPITNQFEFNRLISTYHAPRIPLIVMRDGLQQTIYFNRPQDFAIQSLRPVVRTDQAMLGVSLDFRVPDAAIVTQVTPASPAERAGIQPGDMIIALNNQPIGSSHQVVQTIASMAPGQQVSLDIARQQSQFQVDTILAQRPQPVRHSVGYAPLPLPTVVERTFVPRGGYEVRPIRPGDADRDGRVLDGDGRLPRRVYRNW
jgi:type II secretory pathway component PulC